MNEEDEVIAITRRGYEQVWSWMRLEVQMHELECEPAGLDIGDDGCPLSHEAAFLLVFIVPTAVIAEQAGFFRDTE